MLIRIRELKGVRVRSVGQERQATCVQYSHGAANLKLEDSPDVPQCGMPDEPQAQTEASSLREEVGRQRLDRKEGGHLQQ